MHCTRLQCTALHCTALPCTALRCTALYYTILSPPPNLAPPRWPIFKFLAQHQNNDKISNCKVYSLHCHCRVHSTQVTVYKLQYTIKQKLPVASLLTTRCPQQLQLRLHVDSKLNIKEEQKIVRQNCKNVKLFVSMECTQNFLVQCSMS